MPAHVLRWMRCSSGRARHITTTVGLASGLLLWHHSKAHGHMYPVQKSENRRTSETEYGRLPAWAVSVISGATGECGGQILLYPVETIKVLAQQSGQSAISTVQALIQRHSYAGALRILFRGSVANIPVTMVIGALYLGIFQISTRAITQAIPSNQALVSCQAGECSHTSANDESRAAVLAALLASLAVAVISGPLDMARNRKQAGLVAEPLLTYTFSPRGLRDTLPYIGPFMICSIPHDLAELLVYFQLKSASERLPEGSWLSSCGQQEAVDAALGAAAGGAGVLLSTPADCIKTKLITGNGRALGAPGLTAQGAVTWLGVAAATVRRQGAPGLFVGVVPRMLDEVPGSMLHWVIAERCTRWLQHV